MVCATSMLTRRNESRAVATSNPCWRRERGEDVTDLVLLKLLPHNDTEGNRERGAWVHIAPAIQKDIKTKYEGAGWTKPEDWPAIAEGFDRREARRSRPARSGCDYAPPCVPPFEIFDR